MEAHAEPKLRQVISDFHHFLNIRGDNHKFMEHLFMERLRVEENLLEKLESQIEQLKILTLKSCPNCGIRRAKRYHRSTQTPGPAQPNPKSMSSYSLTEETSEDKAAENIQYRINKLAKKVDKVYTKSNGMLKRSYELENSTLGLQNKMGALLEISGK